LFAEQFAGPGLRQVLEGIYLILPDLSRFQIGPQVVHGLPISPTELLVAATYGLAYILVLLLVAIGIFERRDFK
jgi:hypothetical protein